MRAKRKTYEIDGEVYLKCSKCGEIKTYKGFNVRSEGKYKDGSKRYRSACIRCEKKASMERYEREYKGTYHRKAGYRYTLKTKYNLTEDDYNFLYQKVEGKCQICEAPLNNIFLGIEGKRAAVDHCHDTGKVRSLLCTSCNSGIGHLKDDADLLRKGAEYLERKNSNC